MSSPQAERALRRLIAEVADVEADDLAAIVAELDTHQRERVLSLLAAYRGRALASSTAAAPPMGEFSGLSPWLATRVDTRVETRADARGFGHVMTATATAALRKATQECRGGFNTVAAPAPKAPLERLLGARGRP